MNCPRGLENIQKSHAVKFTWLTLGQSEAACLSEVFAIPLSLAEGIVPGSVLVSIALAIEANDSLSKAGHMEEIRAVIDKYLRNEDLVALESLISEFKKFN